MPEYEDKPWENGPRKPTGNDKPYDPNDPEQKDKPWMPTQQQQAYKKYQDQIRFERSMRRSKPELSEGCIKLICAVIALIIACGGGVWRACNKVSDYRWVTATVSDKGTKRNNKTDRYLVYTDQGTYEITDSLFAGRFDSSDLYGKIEVGKTYQMYIAGERHPFISMYPNLYEVKEVG